MKRLLLALTCGLTFAAGARAQVVDGNLADLIPLAQADQADPINEIIPNCKSGFDVEHVYVYYKFSTDQLFIGIDVMDVPPGSGPGFPGPGVPGRTGPDSQRPRPHGPEPSPAPGPGEFALCPAMRGKVRTQPGLRVQ